jgi:hypothetical protein
MLERTICLLPFVFLSFTTLAMSGTPRWSESHPIAVCIKNGTDPDAFRSLLEDYKDYRVLGRIENDTVMRYALKHLRSGTIDILLEKFTDLIDEKDHNRKDLFYYLYSHKGWVNKQDVSVWYEDWFSTLSVLLKHKKKFEQSKSNQNANEVVEKIKNNTLHFLFCSAAIDHHHQLTQILLEKGADHNGAYFDNDFTLLYDLFSSYLGSLKNTLSKNNFAYKYDQQIKNIPHTIELLFKKGFNKQNEILYWDFRLAKAIHEDNAKEAADALKKGADAALVFDDFVLFDYSITRNKKNEHGIKTLQLMAMHGADFSELYRHTMGKENYRNTLDHWLIQYTKHPNIKKIKELLEQGADPDAKIAKDEDGYLCPLQQALTGYFAASHENKNIYKEIILLLIEKGATLVPDLNQHPFSQWYWDKLVERATDRNSTLTACLAFQKYSRVEDRDRLAQKVEQYFGDDEGLTQLIAARSDFAPSLITNLKKKGFDFTQRDSCERTLLHEACMTNGQKNKVEDRECPPLNPSVVQALLECNVDISRQDDYGKTAWDYVCEFPFEKVAGALECGRDAMGPAEDKVKEIMVLLLANGYQPNPDEDFDLITDAKNILEEQRKKEEWKKAQRNLDRETLATIFQINNDHKMQKILELIESGILKVMDNKLVITNYK